MVTVTDLRLLHSCLLHYKLKFRIGRERTRADGNCFLHMMIQNIRHFQKLGLWNKTVPSCVHKLRADVISWMISRKEEFTGHLNNDGQYIEGPLTEDQFTKLIDGQSVENTYTDEEGFFVWSCCRLLEVSLQIVITSIRGPMIASGVGGPVQKINSEDSDGRLMFSCGLIRDEERRTGHYQFIFEDERGENSTFITPEDLNNPVQGSNGNTTSSSQVASPVKLTRSRIITSYLKSPSPKKTYNDKESHCLFCSLQCKTAESLEEHLHQSKRCHDNYLQNFKSKHLDPILLTKFGCLFCTAGAKIRISQHLKKNKSCQQKFLSKFKVRNIEELLPLLESLRRRMRNSRSRVSRNLENKKQKEKKKASDESNVKTDFELLNSFRRDTSFANVRLCVKCGQNICRGEIFSHEELQIDPGEILEKRRFESYFRCKDCKDGEKLINSKARVTIEVLPSEDRTILLPSSRLPANADPTDYDINSKPITCLFPASLEALDHNSETSATCKSRYMDSGIMYKFDPVVLDVASIAYENELNKYKMIQKSSDRFQGVIKEGEDNILESVDKVTNDHVLVGSRSWEKVEKDLSLHRIEQFGTFCLSLTVPLPCQEDVLASCLVQSGVVVSVEYVGSSTSELDTIYYVHNHLASFDCDRSCSKVKLEEYLPGLLDLRSIPTKFLATILTSTQLKMASFVKHFLKENCSNIHSEDYSLKLKYDLDGTISLVGFIWPKQLDQINIGIANYPSLPVDPEQKLSALKFIDSTISTSTNSATLQAQFGLSKHESGKLANLAKQFQYHRCQQNDCKTCNTVRLPCVFTDFTVSPAPEFRQNIATASRFRELVFNSLKSTSEDDTRSLETFEWLQRLFSSVGGDIIESNGSRIWEIEFGTESLQMLIDKRLLDLTGKYPHDPMIALYHYCLTCSEDNFQVVMKTDRLCDTFSKPYHIGLLKAFKSEIEVVPGNGFKIVRDQNFERSNFNEEESLVDSLKTSHREISLGESFSLLDKTIQRTMNSTSSEYICAYLERKVYFKKINIESEGSFKIVGAPGFYERQRSNIDKYFSRRNGNHVTLLEFVAHYDFMGSEQSRQINKLFSRTEEVSINDSETISAFDPDRKLPELIFTTAGEVMRMRSSKKIVSYPKFEDDIMKIRYSKVLMFFPTDSEIREEDKINEYFFKRDTTGDKDSTGLTIVSRVERFLFPKMNWSSLSDVL